MIDRAHPTLSVSRQRHLLEVKSSRRKRKLSQDQPVAPADVRQVKKLLGR